MDTEVLNECRHPNPQTDMFIIRPDFTFVLLGLFMIVAHTIRMDDTIYFGKTEGSRSDIGPSFRYLNQGLQEFEIRKLMVMRMVSSVLHLLSNAFFTTFALSVPQTTCLAVQHSNSVSFARQTTFSS